MKKSIVRVLALVLMLTLVITSSAAALKLQKNDKSDNVRRLQQALTQLGYYSGTVDGSFGSGTKAAVTAFQQANSLTVDGIVGPKTQAALIRDAILTRAEELGKYLVKHKWHYQDKT